VFISRGGGCNTNNTTHTHTQPHKNIKYFLVGTMHEEEGMRGSDR
jgi:hypothetical protein